MATIQNARDGLLQAVSPRVAAIPLPANVTVDLGNTAQAINNLPSYTRVNGVTAIAAQPSLAYGGPYLTGLGGLAPLSSVSLADTARLTGQLPSYASVAGLTSLAAQSSLTLGGEYLNGFGGLAGLSSIALTDTSRLTGSLSNSRVSGLGALALLASVDLGSGTQVIGNLAANRIAAGALAVGVTYAGTINVDQLNAGRLNMATSGDYLDIGYTGSNRKFMSVYRTAAVDTTDPLVSIYDSTNSSNTGVGLYIFTNRGTALQIDAPSPPSGSSTIAAVRVLGYDNVSSGSLIAAYGKRPEGQITGLVNAGSSAPGVRGQNVSSGYIGLLGTNTHAVYAASGGYGPFTGSHDALLPRGEWVTNGELVEDVALIAAPSVSDALYTARATQAPYSCRVLGVQARRTALDADSAPAALITGQEPVWEGGTLSYMRTVLDERFGALADAYARLTVNALGEGQIKVCGEGGDIEAGDLLVSSSTPGVAMRQNLLLQTARGGREAIWTDEPDDAVRVWTVAKARDSVTFDGPGDVRLVPCIYLCG